MWGRDGKELKQRYEIVATWVLKKNFCQKFGSIVTVSLLCIVTKSGMEKRKCLRQKCGIEFIPIKPKQKYCSTKCRTYAHRESKIENPLEIQIPYIPPSKREIVEQVVNDFTKSTNEVKPKEQPKSNFTINTRPKTLDELKAMCPPELTGLDKSGWVATERQKYGI